QDTLLEWLVRGDVITKDLADVLRKLYKNYVPLVRVFGQEGVEVIPFGRLERQVVKPIKGAEVQVLDPLLSVLRNTGFFIDLAWRNMVYKALAKAVEGAKARGALEVQRFVRPVAGRKMTAEEVENALASHGIDVTVAEAEKLAELLGSRPEGENVIIVRENGKARQYAVHPDIAKALELLTPAETNIFTRLLFGLTLAMRKMYTASPTFAFRQIRDIATAITQSKYPWQLILSLPRALCEALGIKREVYNEWVASGGAYGAFVHLNRTYRADALRAKLLGPRTRKERALWAVGKVARAVDALERLSEIVDETIRLAEYMATKKKLEGVQEAEKRLRAAFGAREVTIDFQRGGRYARDLNNWFVFFNASAQGIDRALRALKADPMGTFIRALAVITVPTVLITLGNLYDPERRRRYYRLSEYTRDTNWVIPLGDTTILIPKPLEWGVALGTVVERFLVWADQNYRGDLWESVIIPALKTTSPVETFLIPSALVPIAETYADKEFFTGRKVVEPGESSYVAGLKHYLKSLSGSLGYDVLGLMRAIEESDIR
ncbi:MAG: LPD38 domain-containing protein, partial [Anaerolineae bacterium]